MRCAILFISAALLGASLRASLGASELPVDSLIDASPAARQAFWGVMVADAETGELLYSRNEDKFFVPASNTKLFTTSLALRRLGADYRFQTRVRVNEKPDSGGRVKELRLLGGG
ncbi:MAG: D-alanyl-D-alanine carboxypeptidase, partial [Bryobacteraceae bacterium]|nr:D-alanyl-D-alanine carboxypeptidase [Bryobacteraceae bacterium]